MTRCPTRPQGFSLQELILSSFILSLLLALALLTVAPGIRISKKAEESMSAQHEVVRAFDRLVGEMSLLDRGGVTVGDGVLSYLSNREFAGANPPLAPAQVQLFSYRTQPEWKKFVILRHRGRDIWIREFPWPDGQQIGRIRRADLPAVADLVGLQEKKFAQDIEQFTVETAGTSRVIMRVQAVARRWEKPEACDVTFEVVMRGGT